MSYSFPCCLQIFELWYGWNGTLHNLPNFNHEIWPNSVAKQVSTITCQYKFCFVHTLCDKWNNNRFCNLLFVPRKNSHIYNSCKLTNKIILWTIGPSYSIFNTSPLNTIFCLLCCTFLIWWFHQLNWWYVCFDQIFKSVSLYMRPVSNNLSYRIGGHYSLSVYRVQVTFQVGTQSSRISLEHINSLQTWY